MININHRACLSAQSNKNRDEQREKLNDLMHDMKRAGRQGHRGGTEITKKKKFFIVGGPTASGKTDFAIRLAKKHNGELINVDSRQIYKYLSIGTNVGDIDKVCDYELPITNYEKSITRNLPLHTVNDVPIHLIHFLEPDIRFDVFSFKVLAEALIEDVVSRGKTPILVGGTGLYIDSLLNGYEIQETGNEQNRELRKELSLLTVSELQDILISRFSFPISRLNNSDKNNPRRLIRLIEKSEMSDEKREKRNEIAAFPRLSSLISRFHVTFYYPKYDLEELKDKIAKRVDEMFNEGLVEETKKVLELGFPKSSVALQGIGYREVIAYLDGDMTLEECKERVKISHRQYARRQRTWFEGDGRGYDLKVIEYS